MVKLNFILLFQEQSRENKATPLSPDDIDEVESPLPLQIQQAVKRRGAISAEPITEEDVASYVKKVRAFYITSTLYSSCLVSKISEMNTFKVLYFNFKIWIFDKGNKNFTSEILHKIPRLNIIIRFER